MWLLRRITLYESRQKITSVGTIEFSDTYKQPTLTKQWNYFILEQILHKYFRYTGWFFFAYALFVARFNVIRYS